MNIRNFFNPPAASKSQDTQGAESKSPTNYKKQKSTHQNLMNQLSEKPEFIIFLDIDGTIFKGFNSVCHSKEYEKLFTEYHQERGYDLPLMELTKDENLEDIDEAILKKARETKVPIFIKTADNRFFIYGDQKGDGIWGFTPVVAQDDIDFSKLPFKRKEITRYDELFNQALINILKQGHAQEKPFYAEYVYKGILRDYAEFKTQTHFFDEPALSHLANLIDILEKKGMKVGIVISSAWREFFDTDVLKKLFCRLHFSKYIIDKIYDEACFYMGEADNPKYATELNRAESIELFLKQNPNIFQFIILDDDYKRDFKELFPKNFIHCKNLYGEKEYQLSLKVVDELLTTPRPTFPQYIQNKVIPIVKKTFDDSRSCNERLLEVSMRVLVKTRHGFLKNILRESRKSPFKNNYEITNLILEYEKEDFRESCHRFGK